MTKENHGADEFLSRDPDERRSFVGYLIHDVSRLRIRYFEVLYKKRGYNRVHWWTLGNIHTRGKSGITQGDLGKLMNVKKALMGTMIDNLEDAGLVERKIAPDDRRVKNIVVTPKGDELATHLMDMVKEITPKFNAGISKRDIDITMRTLLRMRQNIQEEEKHMKETLGRAE